MKMFVKIATLTVVLSLIFLIVFFVWGESLTLPFTQQKLIDWFVTIKPYAWIIGISLLVSDLFLPIPATPVMTALGAVYGPWLGTFVSFAGSCFAGFCGYFIARFLSKGMLSRIASEAEVVQFKGFFDAWGGVAIIVSRMTPILPEVMTLLAGLSKMKISRFTFALSLGTLPTAFLYAYLGHTARSEPVYAVIGATILPLAIWPLYIILLRHSGS